ncbi:LacI family DNA-binding transcriptional regulator [Lapidilactobacillus luobeiensis]|uniref:LacI family DNA-binding transcriptional regulator n=1 Tax=Lapidilactobacillus luobeiensis TaxID=2950371 RepID=UPI0021C37C6E|nr:LacI family DNA-binding transcriptional regulator [Lapidilactobacillus luobeiensis]
MRATIKDVARISGVSTATVSRVLNQLGGYGPEVATKVLAVAKAIGYRRNDSAVSLVKQATRTIGIVMPTVTTSFYAQIINGIEDSAYQAGYSVILTHAGSSNIRLLESLNFMVERRVEGIIGVSINLNQTDLTQIKALAVPLLLLSAQAPDDQLPYVKVDDYQAAYAATRFLIKQGHQRIALAGVDPSDLVAGQPRIAGYEAALTAAQLRPDRNLIFTGDYTFAAGQQAMQAIIARPEVAPTAVFAVSDETALGVISICYQAGIEIPRELSVLGYDNSAIAAMATPALSTVAQPFYQMGQIAAQKMITSLQTKTVITSELVPFKLIQRGTVAVPRSN